MCVYTETRRLTTHQFTFHVAFPMYGRLLLHDAQEALAPLLAWAQEALAAAPAMWGAAASGTTLVTFLSQIQIHILVALCDPGTYTWVLCRALAPHILVVSGGMFVNMHKLYY